ncbi:hypothetical protein [Streptomyces parvus]|uniref:hypothetical protein n=1 Tax=Streptomyces parvus TaxID=66428 RepID=UPI0036400111
MADAKVLEAQKWVNRTYGGVPGDQKLAEVAAHIRAWDPRPGAGAGAVPDVFATGRRTRARDLRDRQNHQSRRNR